MKSGEHPPRKRQFDALSGEFILKKPGWWDKIRAELPQNRFSPESSNYYGVVGNYASLKQFYDHAMRILYKWLNRRSQRRSYNWAGFRELLKEFQVE